MVAAVLLTIIGSAILGFVIWIKPYLASSTESVLIFIGLIVAIVICYAIAIYKFEDATYFFHRLFGRKDPFGKPYKSGSKEENEFELARFYFATGRSQAGADQLDRIAKNNMSARALLGYALVRGLYGYKKNTDKGYDYLNQAEAQENSYAYVYYYYLYTDGLDDEQDEQDGLDWLNKAVELNNPLALVEMGNYIYNKANGDKDQIKQAEAYYSKAHAVNPNYGYEELVDIFLSEAELSPEFIYQSYIRLMPRTRKALYLRACCLEKLNKMKKALKFYEIAANAGDEDAALILGWKYMHGENVPQDINKAMSYLDFCAKKSNPKAYIYIGYGHLYGLLGKENSNEAKKWFKKAADKGDAEGMWFLGNIEERDFNNKEALKWYEKGAALGDDECLISAGDIIMVVDSVSKGINYLKKAADKGNARAMAKLGFYYENDKDYNNAFKYLSLAAEKDHADAQAMLGSLYADGKGCKADMKKSFYWIKKSAENGSARGAGYLSYCYEIGAGCEKNPALAEYWNQVSQERMEATISEL
ncbi:MAG: sel1 repeat family protein [Ruminococcaceae bacterium]|nr:sel1 repeat family protein [Oscillospiraceae bacterium]